MMSLVLVSFTQNSFTPLNTEDVNPELNSVQPDRKIDIFIGEKPIAVPISQSVEKENEVKPAQKKTASAIEQSPVAKVNPAPENVSITQNVQFDTDKANIEPMYHKNAVLMMLLKNHNVFKFHR
jgi:outer membrane protein OmpA-like peptidoglycan-associated protein